MTRAFLSNLLIEQYFLTLTLLQALPQSSPARQKQVSTPPYAGLAKFHLWPQNPVPLGV
jgi:hypothetical protein